MKGSAATRKNFLRFLLILSLAPGLFLSLSAFALVPQDYGLMLWTEIKENPPMIRLKWSPPPTAVTGYILHRKEKDAASWGIMIAILDADTHVYEDTNIETGKAYEYKLTSMNGISDIGHGYIWAGIKIPPMENRGKIILLVEAEVADGLKNELETLRKDLIGDGWDVLRHDVSRHATPQEARQFVADEFNADPGNIKAVFLLGHIPVFGSGSDTTGPDAHTNHTGKWPADAYYGYMENWESNTTPTIPGHVSLQVGRVDFDDMPAFKKSAAELLKQYLNKNHQYRIGKMLAKRDCLIDDAFKGFSGEAFSQTIYRTYSSIWGKNANIFSNNSKIKHSYTWGSYSGKGGRSSVESVTGTALLTTDIAGWPKDVGMIFCSAFGSYFGKWDYPNNLLRAFLATPNYGLACVWSGRPPWYFHHMALGETIGYSTRLIMNNGFGNGVAPTYLPVNHFARGTHIALMGYPSLRMFPVLPASNLRVKNANGKIVLSWTASKDKNVTEYHIYRRFDENKPYVKLAVTNKTTWIDELGIAPYYMVRAKKLTKTASGSYYNLSQGVFYFADVNRENTVLRLPERDVTARSNIDRMGEQQNSACSPSRSSSPIRTPVRVEALAMPMGARPIPVRG